MRFVRRKLNSPTARDNDIKKTQGRFLLKIAQADNNIKATIPIEKVTRNIRLSYPNGCLSSTRRPELSTEIKNGKIKRDMKIKSILRLSGSFSFTPAKLRCRFRNRAFQKTRNEHWSGALKLFPPHAKLGSSYYNLPIQVIVRY